MVAPLTSKMIYDLDHSNVAHQNASAGTLLGRLSPAGYVFYADGNAGDDTANDGSAWGSAFKTLAVAMAASATAIASGAFGWAARNVIYAKGDAFDEDLVLLAPKTDVIGVGSWDQFPYAGLIGNHVPTGATASLGTRFYNFMFRGNAAGGDLWTLDATVSSLAFHGCYFDANSATAATGAIVATASPFLKVYDSQFKGKYSDAVIEFGAGSARGTRIIGNEIEGVNQGIDLDASTVTTAGGGEKMIIADNKILTSTECINDEADIAYILNNNCITLQAKGSAGAGAIVGNELLSSGNKISASDLANADWPALGSL